MWECVFVYGHFPKTSLSPKTQIKCQKKVKATSKEQSGNENK